jgi:enterochelin esterase-like enzyme
MQMISRLGWVIPGFLVLIGCGPTLSVSATPLPPPACDNPGTLVHGEIESLTRGYPYTYVVYQPPCYELEMEREYPVLYLVPGRNGGPNAWFAAGAGEATDRLILDGDLPPFLIVATGNIDSDPMAEAILTDLIPFIESHFRILEGRRYHAVAGGSLGGVAAYRIVFSHPDRFASAAMFGSGLISGEEPQFDTWLKAIPAGNKPRVFLNTGEGDPFMLERARVMVSVLDQAGIESSLVVGEGGHTYSYWISNLPAYFTWLAEDWQ